MIIDLKVTVREAAAVYRALVSTAQRCREEADTLRRNTEEIGRRNNLELRASELQQLADRLRRELGDIPIDRMEDRNG